MSSLEKFAISDPNNSSEVCHRCSLLSVDRAEECTPVRIRYDVCGMTWLWVTYGAGVLVGLAFGDARPAVRTALALLWPVGPAALVATVLILVVAAMIAFPAVAALAVIAAAAWLLV